jgi:predicted NBD/HSP70 family sugar kinase
MSKLVGLFDIGATHTRLALVGDGVSFNTPVIIDTDTARKGIGKLVAEFKHRADGREFAGLVGGLAGEIDRGSGKLAFSPNLPHWIGLNVAAELGDGLGAAVIIENDVAMAALGEVAAGAGHGHRIVMYQTVSTGVNAALVVDGKLQPSQQGFEVGQQLVAGRGGRLTTLEAATGGGSLERQTGLHAHELAASAVWRNEARLLAVGLHNSLVHWSPEVVVLGGSMMHDLKLREIEAELAALPASWQPKAKLVLAELGDIGGLYGALALAKQRGLV